MQNERGKPYCPPIAFTAVSKMSSVALGVAALPALRLAASAIALLSLAQMCGSCGIVEVVISVGGAGSTEGGRGGERGGRREEETDRVRDEEEKERQRQRQVCEREAQSERAGGQGIAGATFHYRTSVQPRTDQSFLRGALLGTSYVSLCSSLLHPSLHDHQNLEHQKEDSRRSDVAIKNVWYVNINSRSLKNHQSALPT